MNFVQASTKQETEYRENKGNKKRNKKININIYNIKKNLIFNVNIKLKAK